MKKLKFEMPKLQMAKMLKFIVQVYILTVHQGLVSVECKKLSSEGNFPPGLFTDNIKAYRETYKEVKILNYDSDLRALLIKLLRQRLLANHARLSTSIKVKNCYAFLNLQS